MLKKYTSHGSDISCTFTSALLGSSQNTSKCSNNVCFVCGYATISVVVLHVRNEKVIIATLRLNPKKNLHPLIATITELGVWCYRSQHFNLWAFRCLFLVLKCFLLQKRFGNCEMCSKSLIITFGLFLDWSRFWNNTKEGALLSERRHATHFKCGR